MALVKAFVYAPNLTPFTGGAVGIVKLGLYEKCGKAKYRGAVSPSAY